MPKTIRNEYYKKLSYENLMKAHNLSKKGKGYRKEIIIFNLKKEEYIEWYRYTKCNETLRKNMGKLLHIKNGCKKIFSEHK